jgi:hypothetical protein
MARTKRLFPFIKSKDPVVILTGAAKALLAEPKRYNQDNWLSIASPDTVKLYPDNYPSCGTVGCVAGWTVALTTKGPVKVTEVNIQSRAQEILGLNHGQVRELFGEGSHVFGQFLQSDEYPESGTTEYALAGAFHIARFVRKHYGVEIDLR